MKHVAPPCKKTLVCLFVLLLSAVSPLLSCRAERGLTAAASRVGSEAAAPLICLVAGCDEAGGHTDALFLCSLDSAAQTLTVVQIPRDTYLAFGGYQNKINQLYPHLLAKTPAKNDKKAALLSLRRTLSDVLGLPIDGAILLRLSDVSAAVDALGGVPVDLPRDVVFVGDDGRRVTHRAGHSLLDGRAALAFLRHRGTYATGDLGRLDAQKIFLSAAFARLRTADSRRLLSLVATLGGRAVIDADRDTISRVTALARRRPTLSVAYVTLPGTPVLSRGDSGLSYYVVCRAGADRLLSDLLPRSGPIDPARRLTSPSLPVVDE
ncbi:MAG: LCP family protein, partial [Clostridia bacterium]|nr:LCP family protein [Clostridia bacterium]